MKFEKAIVVTPGYEQRVAKMAYSLSQMEIETTVIAEEKTAAIEFERYIENVRYIEIPNIGKLKRTPLGKNRIEFLKRTIHGISTTSACTLLLVRDVNYGYIISRFINQISENTVFVLDIADNYDLLYASYSNPLKRIIFKLVFKYIEKKAIQMSDAVLIVAPVNELRLRAMYQSIVGNKRIIVLRNLPLSNTPVYCDDKIEKSFVYVGKIDETARDPMYVLEKLTLLDGYTLHFYSNEKKSTIERIRKVSSDLGISDRVFFHDRVSYDALAREISKYQFGLVPHKRAPITDYTVPNKIYDYKLSGTVTIMSDCPALVQENEKFGFGLVYSKENDNFVYIVKQAQKYIMNNSFFPKWNDEFVQFIKVIENLNKI